MSTPVDKEYYKTPPGTVKANGGKQTRSLVDQKEYKKQQLQKIQKSVSDVTQFVEGISVSTTIDDFKATREKNYPAQVFDKIIQENYKFFIDKKNHNEISDDLMNHIMTHYFPLRKLRNGILTRLIPAKVSKTTGDVSIPKTIVDTSIPAAAEVPVDDDDISLESLESVEEGGAKRKNARRKKKRSTRKSKKRKTRRPTKRAKKSRKKR